MKRWLTAVSLTPKRSATCWSASPERAEKVPAAARCAKRRADSRARQPRYGTPLIVRTLQVLTDLLGRFDKGRRIVVVVLVMDVERLVQQLTAVVASDLAFLGHEVPIEFRLPTGCSYAAFAC
ncbi:hypothetical protein [Variovorax rhizosphaerae]|uniref:Uncharacterized protein n=1 Tax=Variovorax rhizosphaerae TaxID=1836200 RepID=A0ABU8WRN5_9BURK